MATEVAIPPPAMWAQTSDVVFLTFNVECKDPEITILKDSIYFKGLGLPEKKTYEIDINLCESIIPGSSSTQNKGRYIQLTLSKDNKSAPFWPMLTKDKKKLHWLKVDFSKMQEENESDDELGGGGKKMRSFEDMMQSLGGLEDNPDKPSFDDMASDSDDEELPDLE